MTNTDNTADCLERAKMHERLASTTEDGPARMMHQAMAAEFRRRASELGSAPMPQPAQRPMLEIVATLA